MEAAALRADAILSRLDMPSPKGAEIGVGHGALSCRLLERADLSLLMVDSWRAHESGSYRDSGDPRAQLTEAQQLLAKDEAVRRVRFAGGRATVWHRESLDAVKDTADGSLDFVFLDADHSEDGCAADILAWLPKIKPGGLLCGHDYGRFGVTAAVNDNLPWVEIGDDACWFYRVSGSLPKLQDEPEFVSRHEVTVACVKHGIKYGAEYVNVLRSMVARNLRRPHRFVCLTDDPAGLDDGIEVIPLPEGFQGWWAKVALFRPGQFEGRVLYLDLDVCITGSLDDLSEHPGIIQDWYLPGYNSSVIVWDAGGLDHVWTRFRPDIAERLRSDQDWLNEAADLATFPPEWCVSYHGHAKRWPPPGAKVVCFHGRPKPASLPSDWVKLIWSQEGLGSAEFVQRTNTEHETLIAQARENAKQALPWQCQEAPHGRRMAIVGGGPSLKEALPLLRALEADTFALNGAHDFLIDHGIVPHAQVILDARAENAGFVQHSRHDVRHYIAAVCHPDVFRALRGRDVVLWAGHEDGIDEALPDCARVIGGGSTVGLKCLSLGYDLGYRSFHLFGLDSSYSGDDDHAYQQVLNGSEDRIEVWCAGERFQCAPWMAKQAREFQPQARTLIGAGCEIIVHGSGLLPHVARQIATGASA